MGNSSHRINFLNAVLTGKRGAASLSTKVLLPSPPPTRRKRLHCLWKLSLFISCISARTDRFYFVLLTPLPSLLTMEQTHEINVALDMAQLFAIWKLLISQLYNCKIRTIIIKKIKINQKVHPFSVYSEGRKNRIVGERRGKPTTKKQISLRTSMFPLL